jgi:uncharacterized membrane protein YeaQ/YmgE (transglycosylase-associated protein family)
VQQVILFLLIGVVAGWVAGQLTKGSGFGVAGNLIVGIFGALTGGFIFRLVGLPPVGLLRSLLSAVVGAVLFLFLVRVVNKS